MALALGAGWFVSNAGRADAAVELTVSGPGFSVAITTGSPFAVAGSTSTVLDVNISTMNAFLAANGSGYQLQSLSASSDSPGAPADALLSVTGAAQLSNTSGTNAIQITATDTGFTLPTGADKLLGTASTIFTNTNSGDSQTFSGYFNADNVANDTQQAAGTLSFTSHGPVSTSLSASTSPSSASAAAPYGLTGTVNLTLTPAIGATSQDQFTGAVEVGPNVPEPSMVGLLLLSAALIVRRRRTLH
jgi:hypothetical protein